MKEFATYTLLRGALFLSTAAIVAVVWELVTGEVDLLWVIVVALVISGIGSYFVLRRPREMLARRVEERAQRAGTRFEEMRSKEDVD